MEVINDGKHACYFQHHYISRDVLPQRKAKNKKERDLFSIHVFLLPSRGRFTPCVMISTCSIHSVHICYSRSFLTVVMCNRRNNSPVCIFFAAIKFVVRM